MEQLYTDFALIVGLGNLDEIDNFYTTYKAEIDIDRLLYESCKISNIDAILYFLDLGAYPNSYPCIFAMMNSLNQMNVDVIYHLYNHGANFDTFDENGDTPLHIAITKGRYDLAIALVGIMGDYHIKRANQFGQRAIDMALKGSSRQLYDELLKLYQTEEDIKSIAGAMLFSHLLTEQEKYDWIIQWNSDQLSTIIRENPEKFNNLLRVDAPYMVEFLQKLQPENRIGNSMTFRFALKSRNMDTIELVTEGLIYFSKEDASAVHYFKLSYGGRSDPRWNLIKENLQRKFKPMFDHAFLGHTIY